ncbi:MAG: CRTAC1 family protein, partial [Chloroflexota bacterium]
RLSESAQALAILLTDLNGDNAPDIAVGNDFDELDGYWTLSGGTWETLDLFDAFTHSTMSFDIADINNDGSQELFATDMKPYNEDEDTLAAWGPIMEMMDGPTLEGDPQVMVNTLQTFTDDGYQNQSDLFGLEASGWSWSGKFGDLNSDGLEDLYVVNGMIAEDLFGHLPNNELVEENQAYINKGDDGFAPMPSWGLGATESGRGMSMADLDNDGDLDIVVNNLSSPALLFENQLCDGDNITVALQQPDSSNIHAIGARITLTTADATYTRDVIAASGYLSGDDATVHFGFPVETALQSMVVMWPDGMTTSVDAAAFSKNTHLTITRNPID